jgi:hypothetical protein
MSSEKLARLLTDFDRPDQKKMPGRIVPFDHKRHTSAKVAPKPAAVQPEDDDYQRGRADGQAAALAEYEQKLSDERNSFTARLAEEREKSLDEAAAKIADGIAEAGKHLESKIADVAARMLEPFISSAVQKRAIANFVEQLTSITSDSQRPAIRISGPSELLDAVRSKVDGLPMEIEFRPTETAEVSVIIDQIVLETKVKLWVERLKYAVLS